MNIIINCGKKILRPNIDKKEYKFYECDICKQNCIIEVNVKSKAQ